MLFIIAIYNNFKNLVIKYILNELLYGFKPNNNFNILADLEPINFEKLREIKYNKTNKIIAFINVITKANYNVKHKA